MRGALRGEQLIAYMDAEAGDVLRQHIEACDFCTARLEPFIALQGDLLRELYRLHCPGSQVLGDYHLGLLAEAQALTIKEHLAECPYCPAELEALKEFLAGSEFSPDYRKSNVRKLLGQHKID